MFPVNLQASLFNRTAAAHTFYEVSIYSLILPS